MTYKDVGEILAAKSRVYEKLESDVRGLSAEQSQFIPPEGGWSIAAIVEHLAIVDGQMVLLIGNLLKRTEDAGKTRPAASPIEISVEDLLKRSRSEKYVTRDKFSPTGNLTPANSLRMLRDSHHQLIALEHRLDAIDMSSAAFPHWIFGPLTLGQWVAFVGLHEERHLEQIQSIVTRADFPQAS